MIRVHLERPRPTVRANRRRAHGSVRQPVSIGTGGAWAGPLAVAGSAEALRLRYPLVSALLVEMAAQQRTGAPHVRSRQRLSTVGR